MPALVCALGLLALALMWLFAAEDTRDALLCALGAAVLVVLLCALVAWMGPDGQTGYEGSPWEALPREGTVWTVV